MSSCPFMYFINFLNCYTSLFTDQDVLLKMTPPQKICYKTPCSQSIILIKKKKKKAPWNFFSSSFVAELLNAQEIIITAEL